MKLNPFQVKALVKRNAGVRQRSQAKLLSRDQARTRAMLGLRNNEPVLWDRGAMQWIA